MSTRICTLCDAEILIFPSSPFSITTVLETVSLPPNCSAVTVPAEPPLFAPVVTVPALPVPLIAVTDATMAATPVDGNPACPDTANVSNVPPASGRRNRPCPFGYRPAGPATAQTAHRCPSGPPPPPARPPPPPPPSRRPTPRSAEDRATHATCIVQRSCDATVFGQHSTTQRHSKEP